MTIGTVGGGNRETRWAGTGTSPEDDIHSSIVPVKVTSATAPAMPQRIRCLGADGSGSGSDGGGNSSGGSSGGLGMPGTQRHRVLIVQLTILSSASPPPAAVDERKPV